MTRYIYVLLGAAVIAGAMIVGSMGVATVAFGESSDTTTISSLKSTLNDISASLKELLRSGELSKADKVEVARLIKLFKETLSDLREAIAEYKASNSSSSNDDDEESSSDDDSSSSSSGSGSSGLGSFFSGLGSGFSGLGSGFSGLGGSGKSCSSGSCGIGTLADTVSAIVGTGQIGGKITLPPDAQCYSDDRCERKMPKVGYILIAQPSAGALSNSGGLSGSLRSSGSNTTARGIIVDLNSLTITNISSIGQLKPGVYVIGSSSGSQQQCYVKMGSCQQVTGEQATQLNTTSSAGAQVLRRSNSSGIFNNGSNNKCSKSDGSCSSGIFRWVTNQ